MVVPGATAGAEATCVMARSAPCTVVEIEMLFGVPGFVPVSLTATEMFVIVVPPTAPEFTATTIVKFTDVAAALAELAVQTIDPVPPAAGVVPHVQPPGGVAETKVVLAGVDCASVAPFAAVVALLFVTVSAKVICPPVATGLGVAVPETESGGGATLMLAVALEPPGVAVMESVSVPFGVAGPTDMVIVNVVALPV